MLIAKQQGDRLGEVNLVKVYGLFAKVGRPDVVIFLLHMGKTGSYIVVKVNINPLPRTGTGIFSNFNAFLIKARLGVQYEDFPDTHRITGTQDSTDVMWIVHILQHHSEVGLPAGGNRS